VKTMKRFVIVCPADLSARTRRAVAQAAVLARFQDAELHLLHVPRECDGRPPPCHEDEDVNPMVADAIRSAFRDLLAVPGRQVRFRITAECGSAERAIASYARRKSASLIVINADYGRERAWRGHSVARALGRSAPCPVLVLPAAGPGAVAAPRVSFSEVLCAVDFAEVSSSAVEAGLAFIHPSGGRLTLLHTLQDIPGRMVFSGGEAAQVAREYEHQVATASRRLLRLVPIQALKRSRVERIVGSGVPHRHILHAASEVDADLIVMGTTPRSGLDELLGGSTSRSVLRGARCPVLLVPTGEGPGRRRHSPDVPPMFFTSHPAEPVRRSMRPVSTIRRSAQPGAVSGP
jgi:nucleotide-binding universal stress UspA family protein